MSFVNYSLVQLSSNEEGKITISYPSEKRTALIVNEAHQKICKAIFQSDKVEKTVLDVLTISNPDEVVASAANIVNAESKEVCKRNSGSLLQKDHASLKSFTWDKFHKELEIRAPNLLKVVSAVVRDVPVAPAEKKFMHILHTIATVIHGRKSGNVWTTLMHCIFACPWGIYSERYPKTSQNWFVCQPWVCT